MSSSESALALIQSAAILQKRQAKLLPGMQGSLQSITHAKSEWMHFTSKLLVASSLTNVATSAITWAYLTMKQFICIVSLIWQSRELVRSSLVSFARWLQMKYYLQSFKMMQPFQKNWFYCKQCGSGYGSLGMSFTQKRKACMSMDMNIPTWR